MPSLADLATVGSVAAPVAGGIINANAAGNATNALTQGGNAAIGTVQQNNEAVQKLLAQIYGNNQTALAPYTAGGPAALTTLQQANAPGGSQSTPIAMPTMAELQNDPGYQERIRLGNELLKNKQASKGSLMSGGGIRSAIGYNQDLASQEYTDLANRTLAYGSTNKQQALNALLAQINTAQGATNKLVDTGNTYGAQSVASSNATAKTISELQTQIASAKAAGNVAQANALTQTLQGVMSGITNAQGMKTLQGLINPATPTVAGTPAAAAATPIGETVPGIPSNVGSPLLPNGGNLPAGLTFDETTGQFVGAPAAAAGEVAPVAAEGAATAGEAAGTGAAAAGAGEAAAAGTEAGAAAAEAAGTAGEAAAAGTATEAGGGALSSVAGFLTNPITIGVGAAILGITALLKSQAHWEANDWVQHFQNPFDQHMSELNQQFGTLAQSGQLTKDQAMQIRQSVADAGQQYESKLAGFAKKGGDSKKVATQAQETADKAYGPGFSKTLSWMDGVIAGLA